LLFIKNLIYETFAILRYFCPKIYTLLTELTYQGHKPILIVLVGPTAVGKTEFCVNLAQKLKSDVFSADSRQFYRELNIGTAKPTSDEMKGVFHHYIDSHSITEYFSAGDYERQVTESLQKYFLQNKIAILTGGSGLYIKALLDGMDMMPAVDETLRKNLMNQLKDEGLMPLSEKLKSLDPITYSSIDINNSQRVVRALEVCISTGRPFSEFKKDKKKILPFETIKIGLERPRSILYERINQRVDQMINQGLISEVESLIPFKSHNALQTVGYKEVFDFFESKYSYHEMIELLKRNTRRYAKRQLTWFKNQDNFEWFEAENQRIIFDHISEKLNSLS
jgi:tRNA dimethylallyltransferase